MLKQYEAHPLLERRFLLAEGPHYNVETDTLLWVDIKTGALLAWDFAAQKLSERQVGQCLGAAVPTAKGRILAAMTTGVYLLDEDGLRLVCRPKELTANLRLNDAKCDGAGRFWFGTIQVLGKRTEQGSLFRLNPDGSCRRMVEGPVVSNGMAWSKDGKTMYYIDTHAGGVDAFDYDLDSGEISERRRVVSFQDGGGKPDGMSIDEEGMLWVALWGGGRVVRCNPASGEVLGEIPLPAQNVTSCCFGGKGLDTLYITTAGEGFLQAEAGRVYVAKPGVCGRAGFVFDDCKL